MRTRSLLRLTGRRYSFEGSDTLRECLYVVRQPVRPQDLDGLGEGVPDVQAGGLDFGVPFGRLAWLPFRRRTPLLAILKGLRHPLQAVAAAVKRRGRLSVPADC